jgi:hypothetical protein
MVICTDADIYISPGPMCREFLCEHFNIYADNIPIILAKKASKANLDSDDKKLRPEELKEKVCVPVLGTKKEIAHNDFLPSLQETKIVYIQEVWPHPNPYRWVPRDKMEKMTKVVQASLEDPTDWDQTTEGAGISDEWSVLYEALEYHMDNLRDEDTGKLTPDQHHPVFYVAGVREKMFILLNNNMSNHTDH